MLFNQVETCGYFLDFVIYDKLSKKSLAIEVDGKHHFYSDGYTHTDEHEENNDSQKSRMEDSSSRLLELV